MLLVMGCLVLLCKRKILGLCQARCGIVVWGLLLLQTALPSRAAEVMAPLAPFGVADEVYRESLEVREYRFITGALSVVGGKLQSRGEWILRGSLHRVTWEIPSMHGVSEVFEYHVAQVRTAQGDLLYRCAGRECGPSNDWANRVFKRPALYGPDREQRYLAALVPTLEGRLAAVAVYVIRRGNQRVYAHLEWLEIPAEQAAVLGRESRMLAIDPALLERPQALTEAAATWLEPVLAKPDDYRIYVVSYYRDDRHGLAASLDRARRQGERLRAWLAEQRVPPERIEAIVVGPFGEDAIHAPGAAVLRLFREPWQATADGG